MVGRREIVGLLLFALAALAALTFLDPTAFSTGKAPPVSLGEDPPTNVPAPTRTPVIEPVILPSSWFVSFYLRDEAGKETFFSRATLSEVNLEFAGAPVGALKDDSWTVLAEGPVNLPFGRYKVRVVHDGAVEVMIGGETLATADDGEGEHMLDVTFDHRGGSLVLGVKGIDAGGPFSLRVEPGDVDD